MKIESLCLSALTTVFIGQPALAVAPFSDFCEDIESKMKVVRSEFEDCVREKSGGQIETEEIKNECHRKQTEYMKAVINLNSCKERALLFHKSEDGTKDRKE